VKAAALAAYDAIGTRDSFAIARAAEIVHLPRQTIWHWVHRARLPEAVQRLRQVNRLDLADRLEETAHRIIDHIPEKLESAPLNQLAVTMGIAIDKRLLLQGQPNSIQAGVHLTQEQRIQRLDAIFAPHMAQSSRPNPVSIEPENINEHEPIESDVVDGPAFTLEDK
jgi:hypothetical protein